MAYEALKSTTNSPAGSVGYINSRLCLGLWDATGSAQSNHLQTFTLFYLPTVNEAIGGKKCNIVIYVPDFRPREHLSSADPLAPVSSASRSPAPTTGEQYRVQKQAMLQNNTKNIEAKDFIYRDRSFIIYHPVLSSLSIHLYRYLQIVVSHLGSGH